MHYFNITPCPKPRQTQSDKWKKRPPVLRYRAFADEVRLKMTNIENGWGHHEGMNGKVVVFHMPMPKSWSMKKKLEMAGEPHQQKPDLDNLLKSLLDALYGNDAHIWDIHVKKRWSGRGGISIS